MSDKITFSAAVSAELPHLKGMQHERDKALLIASGIGDEQGNPTELARFLDKLYGPCLEDGDFFRGRSDLFRMIAAGKTIWEGQRRFPSDLRVKLLCAVGAIIAKGSIHRRKCVADFSPFFGLSLDHSDLLDEAAELIRTTADLNSIDDGKKNAELSQRGIDATRFRVVRAEWSRMSVALDGELDVKHAAILDHDVRLRCAILAGTHWVNTFNRCGILQDVSVCSVLYRSALDIQSYGPQDMVVVGWNFPMSAVDAEWYMPSDGYPLTIVTKEEMRLYAPDLLDLPLVKKQLAGEPAPGWLKGTVKA